MSDTFSEIKNKADLVRKIDLVSILKITGAIHDQYDNKKWHTSKGVISVSGPKFINWRQGLGGGGAIDLIIHLKNLDFKAAVLWLADRFPLDHSQSHSQTKSTPKRLFQPPREDKARLTRVIDYLSHDRSIPLSLLQFLITSGILYADLRGNAVFLLLGKENTAVGAELRGTTHIRWRGMAPGSRKDLGFFRIGNSTSGNLILCESAIDALSFLALQPHWMVLSTSGATSSPAWLQSFIKNAYHVYCGFDADQAGDLSAQRMIALYPTIKRLRPHKHDWNDVLTEKSQR